MEKRMAVEKEEEFEVLEMVMLPEELLDRVDSFGKKLLMGSKQKAVSYLLNTALIREGF
ncbi:MAG: hypothetical protein MRY49_03335 [Candidatus Pacebacteria bacterium]|nr:hypothetical protein [Candidatus Paceibacterota bacterium]